ncbi:hypothetical protein TNCV_5087791 [Trichonephila clavipes]|nr:hypothetical protein TNCV_5087791 [Trichonephila clavipes]
MRILFGALPMGLSAKKIDPTMSICVVLGTFHDAKDVWAFSEDEGGGNGGGRGGKNFKVEPHYVNTHQFLNLKAFPPRPPWNSSVFNGYAAKLSTRMIVIKMGKGKFIYNHRRSNHGMEACITVLRKLKWWKE